MNKLNINFKKSKWKSKSMIDFYLRSSSDFPVVYRETVINSPVTELKKRRMEISFLNSGLKTSKDQLIIATPLVVEDSTTSYELQPIGLELDTTILSLGQRKYKLNTTLLSDVKLVDGLYKMELKLLYSKELKSVSKTKKLREDCRVLLAERTSEDSLRSLLGKIALSKFEKELFNSLKISQTALSKVIIIKIKRVNENNKKSKI